MGSKQLLSELKRLLKLTLTAFFELSLQKVAAKAPPSSFLPSTSVQ